VISSIGPNGQEDTAPLPDAPFRPEHVTSHGVVRNAATARAAAREGLRKVSRFPDAEFQAVLDLLAYGKTYHLQWQVAIQELLQERGVAERERRIEASH
jgi:hypothetical protein